MTGCALSLSDSRSSFVPKVKCLTESNGGIEICIHDLLRDLRGRVAHRGVLADASRIDQDVDVGLSKREFLKSMNRGISVG